MPLAELVPPRKIHQPPGNHCGRLIDRLRHGLADAFAAADVVTFRLGIWSKPIFLSVSMLLAGTAHAQMIWIERDGEQAQVRVGELSAPLPALPALRDAKAVRPDGTGANLNTAVDRFSFVAGDADARFTAARIGADGVLTYFQARHGRRETKAVNDLELVPTEAGGSTFRLIFKGYPTKAGRINVETAAGWRKSFAPNPDGSVTLDTPIPGLYVLQVSAKLDNADVTIDGKKYADVRYTATLSFEVPGK